MPSNEINSESVLVFGLLYDDRQTDAMGIQSHTCDVWLVTLNRFWQFRATVNLDYEDGALTDEGRKTCRRNVMRSYST